MNINSSCDKCLRKGMCSLLSVNIKEIINKYKEEEQILIDGISLSIECKYSKEHKNYITGYPAGTHISKHLNCPECEFREMCRIFRRDDNELINAMSDELNNIHTAISCKLICYGYNKDSENN